MGKLAVGLTCFDVQNMDIDLILHYATALDFQIGDTVTPDLVTNISNCLCIGLSVFLSFTGRMHCY